MMNKVVEAIEKEYSKQDIPEFSVGDTVKVHVRIIEGEKERIQIFQGTVIGRRGSGTRETFTVRRLLKGYGVERTFLIQSPRVARVEVTMKGDVKRAKLYYLRDRVGKATKVKARRQETATK